MLTKTTILGNKQDFKYLNCIDSFTKNPVWFDIETTGLTPSTSNIYLIGAVKLEEDNYVLYQWISEDYREEPKVISSFLSFIDKADSIIHFNGASFDIPFIQQKIEEYKLFDTLQAKQSIDIYKKLKPYKNLLGMKKQNLQYSESFFGYHRTDNSNGGDLIQVFCTFLALNKYEKLLSKNNKDVAISSNILPENKAIQASNETTNSLFDEQIIMNPCRNIHTSGIDNSLKNCDLPKIPKTPSSILLEKLLLHNKEDLIGTMYLTRLFEIFNIFDGKFNISQITNDNETVKFSLSKILNIPVPQKINYFQKNIAFGAGKYPPIHNSASDALTHPSIQDKPSGALTNPPVQNTAFVAGTYSPLQNKVSDALTHSSVQNTPFGAGTISLKNQEASPETTIKDIPLFFENETLTITNNTPFDLEVRLKVHNLTLKYFYENYKDYYYLPLEDTAMHKSVANFVDKEYRTQAKAATCYTKKESRFLPAYSFTKLPLLKNDYKDKSTYIELTDALLTNTDLAKEYLSSILSTILSS